MKRISSLLLALLLLFSLSACEEKPPAATATAEPTAAPTIALTPTPTQTPEIAMPLSAEEFEGLSYREAEKKLQVLGFTNVELEEYADLTSVEEEKDETVRSVSIGGSKRFDVGASFPADAKVVLEYHVLRRAALPLSSGDLGTDAEAAAQRFKDAGFVNVHTETLEDLAAGAEPSLSATVNGSDVFARDEEIPFDAEICIYTHVPGSARSGLTELTAEQIYASCSPAVFFVEIYDNYGWVSKTGSGFFLTEDGIAVTNYHVISGAAYATVTLSDTGEVYDVLGVYDYSVDEDWAVLQIGGSGFHTLEVGDQDYDVGGATVYAIGSPLGLQNTISMGIISNPHRWDGGVNYIQMSAAISPGSSGGALLNKYGQVIGITSATYTEGQNLNLAIPMTYLEDAVIEKYTPLGSSSVGPSGVLTLVTSQVSIGIGDSADVGLTAIEQNCTGVSVRYSIDNGDIVSCEWQGWHGDDNTLRITGLSVGSTQVTIYFLISETDTVLDSKTVQVTVTPEGAGGGTYSDVDFYTDIDSLYISLFAGGSIQVHAYYAEDNDNTYVSWYADDPNLLSCEWSDWYEDDTALFVQPISAGSTVIHIVYCTEDGAMLAMTSIPVIIFYAAIEVSEMEIGLEEGDEYTITVTIRSDNPGRHTLRYEIYGDDVISCSWGSWFDDNITCPLTITALQSGEADIEILLLDAETEQYLYSVSIPVSVE